MQPHMQTWVRQRIVEHLERLRADCDAIEREGNQPPAYVLKAIDAAEAELARRDTTTSPS